MSVARLYEERVRRMDVAALKQEAIRLHILSKSLLAQAEELRRILERRVETVSHPERVKGGDARSDCLQNQRSETGFGCEMEG